MGKPGAEVCKRIRRWSTAGIFQERIYTRKVEMIQGIDRGDTELEAYALGDRGLLGDAEVKNILRCVAQSIARHIAEGGAEYLLRRATVDNEADLVGRGSHGRLARLCSWTCPRDASRANCIQRVQTEKLGGSSYGCVAGARECRDIRRSYTEKCPAIIRGKDANAICTGMPIAVERPRDISANKRVDEGAIVVISSGGVSGFAKCLEWGIGLA